MELLHAAWWSENLKGLWTLLRSPQVDGWLLIRWLTQNLLLAGWIFMADMAAGLALLRGWAPRMPLCLKWAAGLALGSGFQAVALFWIGFAGGLRHWVPGMATGLAGAVGLWMLALPAVTRKSGRPTPAWRRGKGSWGWRSLALAVLAFLVLFPAALHVCDLSTPVVEFDSLLYHMRSAQQYLKTHSLAYHGELRYNAHPQLNVLLLIRSWTVLGDDAAAKFQNLEFTLMLLFVVFYAAQELRWTSGWILAASFVFSSPLLWWVSKVEYADLALAGYAAVGIAALFHWLRNGESVVVPAGLALGFAASVKLMGHVVAACIGLAFLLALAVRRTSVSRMARSAAALAGLASAVCCGWWLRSWMHTGSPVYPFFVKGHPDVAQLFHNDAAYGLGRDAIAFLLLPWRMMVGPPQAFADAFEFGPAGLVLVAALAIGMVRIRKTPPPEILFLALIIAIYVPVWFLTSQVMRYLLWLLAPGSILLIWVVKTVHGERWLAPTAAMLLTSYALYAAVLTSTMRRYEIPPAVTTAGRRQALAAALPYYPVLRELNRLAAPGDKTYLLFCEEYKYYLDTPAWGDWFGDLSYRWLSQNVSVADDIPQKLRKLGFRWMVVERERARRASSWFGKGLNGSLLLKPYADLPGAHTVYSDRTLAVFRLW